MDEKRIIAETFVAAVAHFAELGSTNDWAKDYALTADGELPLLVVTDRQTAGRGRGANRWWSGEGSLTFSLVLPAEYLPEPRSAATLVSLATAVAVVESLVPLATPHQVGIHWPNDIFAAGRKLGGILIETVANRRHVLGIGLNINNRLDGTPPEIRQSATALAELTAQTHDPAAILIAILRSLDGQLAELRAAPEQVAAQADRLCLQHGQFLTLRIASREITGRCLGIAPDGCLMLQTAEGPQHFASGVLRSNHVLPNANGVGTRRVP